MSVSKAMQLCGATLICTVGIAHAQSYPSKPVRVIVPTAPGGPSDLNGRGVTAVLAEALGQPFVVENRPGADSMIGNEACARSNADGYTLCTSDSGGYSLNPAVRLRMPYDPLRDLTPIIHTGYLNSAFVVHPSLGVNTLQEFLKLARSKPGTISFATAGLTSQPSVLVEWLRNTRGIDLLAVPYKVQTEGMAAVFSGQTMATTFVINQVVPFARSGKVKALAHNGEGTSRYMPELPTYKDAGLPFAMRTWLGFFAPAGTPRDIIQRLHSTVVAGLSKNQAVAEKFQTTTGLEWDAPAGQPTDAFAAFLKSDREYYATIMKEAGIKPE